MTDASDIRTLDALGAWIRGNDRQAEPGSPEYGAYGVILEWLDAQSRLRPVPATVLLTRARTWAGGHIDWTCHTVMDADTRHRTIAVFRAFDQECATLLQPERDGGER